MNHWIRLVPLFAASALAVAAPASIHVWEKHEITLTSGRSYANPYANVTVWVDLSGPGFNRRVYGFWDGERTFRVRVTATNPGQWTWRSGSEPQDSGLAGKSGSFTPSPSIKTLASGVRARRRPHPLPAHEEDE